MIESTEVPSHASPKLAVNLLHFARALRQAGLPIGSGQVLTAIEAVAAAGFSNRSEFYWTLHAVFVSRPEEREVFTQTFRLFWRDPRYVEHLMALLLPALRGLQPERVPEPAERRAAEALVHGATRPPPFVPEQEDEAQTRLEIDATATASAEERLKQLDFEQMTAEEASAARRLIARLALALPPLPSRRLRPDARGPKPDFRRTLRQSLRTGGEITTLAHRDRRPRWPALVVLCDISGSMAPYSRMILHFAHALANRSGRGWSKVHVFTFGTRLTNLTRHFRQRDVDRALAAAGREAPDWQGGTRIGECLHRFNHDWSRRVLGQGAVVLLVTDGLERGDPALLRQEMERLSLSCRRLIWVNPLLRWEGFVPKAEGIRAMLPFVDAFHAGHSLRSLEALAAALADPTATGEKARMLVKMTKAAAGP